MKLDDGKTISLSERLSSFLADHGDCGGSLETARKGALVTVTCASCGRSFSYASRVPERTDAELIKALDRLSEAVETTRLNTSNGAAEPSSAERLKLEAEAKWEAPHRRAFTPPRRRRRVAPPGPYAPRSHRSASAEQVDDPSKRRLRAPGPLVPRRIARRGFHRIRHLRRRMTRVQGEVAKRRREIALTVLGLAGAYVIVALSSGAEQSSSRPEEAVQGESLNALVESGEPGTAGIVDRIQLLDGRLSVVLPRGWKSVEPLGGSAILRSADGAARIVILPEPLARASGSETTSSLQVDGKPYVAILRHSPDALESALDEANVALRSLRPAE